MKNTSNHNFTTPKSLQRIALLESLLAKGGKTAIQLMPLMGIAHGSVCAYLRQSKLLGLAHIDSWILGAHGGYSPVWVSGRGDDASKPQLKARARREAASKQKQHKLAESSRGFKPQTVARDWSVEMMFGPAYVGLNAELRGMA